jgi:hypothetical protein
LVNIRRNTLAPFRVLINPVSARQKETDAHAYSIGPTHRTRDSAKAMGWNVPLAIKDIFSCSKRPAHLWGTSSQLFNGYYVLFTGSKRRNVKLATHLEVGLRLRMSGAIHLIPLYALMTWTWKTLPYYFPAYAANNCLFLVDTQNYSGRKF